MTDTVPFPNGSSSEMYKAGMRDLKRAQCRLVKEEREEERRRKRKKAELEREQQAAQKATKVWRAREIDTRSTSFRAPSCRAILLAKTRWHEPLM